MLLELLATMGTDDDGAVTEVLISLVNPHSLGASGSRGAGRRASSPPNAPTNRTAVDRVIAGLRRSEAAVLE